MLKLVAGDVETNPGPMVSALSSNIHHSNMLFQDQDANVPKTKKDKNENCSNCEFLRCKILEPQGSREESNPDQFVVELSTTFDAGNTTDSSYFSGTDWIPLMYNV